MLRPCAEVGYSNVHASHLLAATRLAQMSELGLGCVQTIGRHAAVVANRCRRPMSRVGASNDWPKWVSRRDIALLEALSGLQAARMAAIRRGLPTMFITRVRL